MRALGLIPLALVTAGCWSPGPEQRDPIRYPWDPRNQALTVHPRIEARGAIPRFEGPPPRPPQPPSGSYCVMALDPGSASGITVGPKAQPIQMACSSPAEPPRKD